MFTHQQELHVAFDDDRHCEMPLGFQVATICTPPAFEFFKVNSAVAILVHCIHCRLELSSGMSCTHIVNPPKQD